MPYRTLDAEKIAQTLEKLHARIIERFPESGLSKVCSELVTVARTTRARVAEIALPHVALRAGSWAIIIIGFLLLMHLLVTAKYKLGDSTVFGIVQSLEALLNIAILVGAGVFFLTSLETRWKRGRALGDLHQLRSIVHVIDMHQLTKDPSRHLEGRATKSSPVRTLTPFELVRYLDYCSEMLSLAAKLAALYGQSTRDATVLAAVSELETMAANLSSKIWQKITMIPHEEPKGAAQENNTNPNMN